MTDVDFLDGMSGDAGSVWGVVSLPDQMPLARWRPVSVRTLEPWEKKVWADREQQGRRAAQGESSKWRSMSPLELRKEIRRLEANFRSNWKEIAFLQGQLQVVDDRFREKRPLGANLKGYLEAAKSKSLWEWL